MNDKKANKWFVKIAGSSKWHGPLPLAKLQRAANQGKISENDIVRDAASGREYRAAEVLQFKVSGIPLEPVEPLEPQEPSPRPPATPVSFAPAPAGNPSSATRREAPGFLETLLGFDYMLAPVLTIVQWRLALLFCLLSGPAFGVFVYFRERTEVGLMRAAGDAALAGLVVEGLAILFAVHIRLLFEGYVVLFKIQEYLRDLRDMEARRSSSGAL